MEIRSPPPPVKQNIAPSPFIKKKNINFKEDNENCECCHCVNSESQYFKYIQPEVPKSYKPISSYRKADTPLDKITTYKSNFENTGCNTKTEPIKKKDTLAVGDGKITDETTHKLSYFGNWDVKRESPILPKKELANPNGSMQDTTTNKDSYTWTCASRTQPVKVYNNLYCPQAIMSGNTTYKWSYYESGDVEPVPESFKPNQPYVKSDIPMTGCTTHNLSYCPYKTPEKEIHPWNRKIKYQIPQIPFNDCTTYRMSYWPNDEVVKAEPINPPLNQTEDILNVSDEFNDNTTYNLSYFSCGENVRREPIKPATQPPDCSSCPLSRDTVNRLSYLGNWNPMPDRPYIPHALIDQHTFGNEPTQKITVQKQDFTWKLNEPSHGIKPDDNLGFSDLPLEDYTTHKLSYFPNDVKKLEKSHSFKPPMSSKYQPTVPLDAETTMRLSYQPVDVVIPQETPWAPRSEYHPPCTPMNDTTVYNQSYIPPGILVPVSYDEYKDYCNNCCSSSCPHLSPAPQQSFPPFCPSSNMCQDACCSSTAPLNYLSSTVNNTRYTQCPS